MAKACAKPTTEKRIDTAMMTKLAILALKELRALLRDWHGLLVLFAMPAVFILIMSLALRDTFRPPTLELGAPLILDQDSSEASAQLLEPWRTANGTELPQVATRAELEQQLRSKGRLWAIVVAEDFSSPNRPDIAPAVEVLAEPGLPMAALAAVQAQVERQLALTQARRLFAAQPVLAMQLEQMPSIRAMHVAANNSGRGDALSDGASGAGQTLTATQQSVPAWLTFAMFFVVIPLSTIVIAERTHGTLMRLATMQVSPLQVLLGKLAPFYLINLIQTGLMLLVGRFLVPQLGGDPLSLNVDWLALWLIASAVSLAALGFGLLVASFARSIEQATTIGGVSNILFGAVGGIMVPTLVMPAFMRELAQYSPMNWGLEGFLAVFLRDGGVSEVLPYAGLLIALCVTCLLIASRVLAKAMRS
jgi:ABC-2 type transport system permease protein